jgi:imidazolonepropionase-like amidohydrolase
MRTLIADVRLFDGTGAPSQDDTAVLVEDSLIAWAGHREDAPASVDEVIDGRGRTLLPGLIDCHTHLLMGEPPTPGITSDRAEVRALLRGIANARRCLETGITAVRDLGWRSATVVDLAVAVERGEITGPEIVAAARFIAPRGGYGAGLAREVDSSAEAATAANEQILDGARVLKVIASPVPARPGERPVSESFGVEALRAVAEVAHAAGLRVSAHAHGLAGARDAVEAGVDCIEHGYRLDAATIDAMAAHGTWLVPTMVAMEHAQAPNWGAGVPDETARRARERWEAATAAARMANRAGVRIAAGTDSFAIVSVESIRREVHLLVAEGGMTPVAALHAATGAAADLLGIDGHTGRIEAGKRADLLLVEGDPTSDPGCLSAVAGVCRRGVWLRQ